uniref:Uncharacterized protein n=1 Tax=Mola mola TaxID=94237 RepID=A0A3Q3WRG4_MOLML
MPLQNDDPAHLSKSRLKSDLVAHNVAVPPANSKKDVYVELRCRHIGRQRAVDFSSDEEDHDKEGEDPGDAEVPDPCVLTDRDLMAALLQHGFKAGPIVASTRALYEKKLRRLLQAAGRDGHLNGEENGALFSDSEDEQEGVPAEPVSDVLKDLFPDTKTMPTGIYATRRRPIKGAAGRPIQYKYPDTPTSPTTLERREVERRLVPIHIQILLFLILVVLLYLIYAFVEDGSFSSLNALLDGQNQGSDNGERLLGQAYSQDAPALSGHE